MEKQTFVQKLAAIFDVNRIQQWVVDIIAPISAETLNWIGIVLIHASTFSWHLYSSDKLLDHLF